MNRTPFKPEVIDKMSTHSGLWTNFVQLIDTVVEPFPSLLKGLRIAVAEMFVPLNPMPKEWQ